MLAHETHGAGAPLVLLHGVGLDRGMWERCVPGLASVARVILPDLPGHGRSPRLPGETTLAALAGAVAGLCDGPTHVVGFSLGALIAAELALSHAGRVSTLILVSSVANRAVEERAAVCARLALAERDFEQMIEQAIDRWLSPALPARGRELPKLVDRVRRTMLASDRAGYLACYRVFAEADAALWPRLPAIRVPTLVVTGGEDPGSTPAMAGALARAIPGARAVVLPGVRHLLPLERPDELVALIRDHVQGCGPRGQAMPLS